MREVGSAVSFLGSPVGLHHQEKVFFAKRDISLVIAIVTGTAFLGTANRRVIPEIEATVLESCGRYFYPSSGVEAIEDASVFSQYQVDFPDV
jgi:hypothetical protein